MQSWALGLAKLLSVKSSRFSFILQHFTLIFIVCSKNVIKKLNFLKICRLFKFYQAIVF
ncbi:hypothetical protein KIS1582_0633 [Cytobacillus firmus]|uniref:Uncharacterized protein n=1 Tax=Cytobacillus firmus TaxID=1399 RepID=A0A800NF96_CYTFI|nr:hypothetical protein KIS1582_0633 [Cytobacillus firmus]